MRTGFYPPDSNEYKKYYYFKQNLKYSCNKLKKATNTVDETPVSVITGTKHVNINYFCFSFFKSLQITYQQQFQYSNDLKATKR